MIPLMNFQERALNGPVMKSDDFDLAFSSKLRELVSNYDIKYNPEELIVDDATADAVFMAGVDLLADVGLYHLDTNRVIKYSREEILEFVNERKEHPGRAVFGLGDDEMTLAYRTGDDTRSPTLYAGSWGAVDEELFIPLAQSFAQEEMNEGMGISCGLARLGNIEAKAGTLSEIHVGLWEQRQLQEVLSPSLPKLRAAGEKMAQF
jgi:methylamine--corrinoid protein Co-methyltransferase